MKYIFTLLLCFGFLLSTNTYGQEETKKVVVIKKMKDENGKTTTERQEASGKDADELIKKMKEDGTLDGIDIDIEIEKAKQSKNSKSTTKKEVSLEKTMKDGKEIISYKIVTEKDGEKKVVQWEGEESEMPAEIKEMLKDEESHVVKKERGGKKSAYKIITEDDGEQNVMIWDGDGEMPAEMAKALKDVDIKTTKDGEHIMITVEEENEDNDGNNWVQKDHEVEKKIKFATKSENRVTLGVMIEDDSNGVVVSSIVDGSVAQKSGLKSGDTILKVNDTYIFSTDMLLKALSEFDKEDKAKVTFLRNGKEKKVKVKF